MDTQDSTDFISALTEAEEAGISKDDFLRIWDMEAKLRLLREVEKSKGLKQEESKLQNSMTSTQVKSNGCKGNHKQPENSTEEVKKSSGLQEVEIKEEIKKDLAKDIPQTRWDASASINAALIFETFKKNFDQMRKEVAEEMHQLKGELKNLKDTLPARCEKSVHDKLCPEISEKKQELVGLREEVKEWRNEFLELKEAVLAMSRKLEEVNRMGSLNASVNQKLYDMERRLAVMDNRGISSSAVDAETQTLIDDNIKQENRESSTGAETGEVEKSEDVEEKQKEVNKSSREDQLNNGSKLQSHQNKEQQLAQPQITQGDQSDLQQTQQEKQQQQQKLTQDKSIQEQQVKDQVQQQNHQQKQQQGSNSNQAKQPPQQKDIEKTLSNTATAKKTSQNSEIPLFSKNGTVFEVKDLKERLAEKEPIMISPLYRLPNSSKTVSLCVGFSDDRKLNVQLLVFDEQPATDNEIYSVTGQIQNRTTGTYSWLFEGMRQISKCQGPDLKVSTLVCLETTKGYHINVSLDELEKRNYVCDNSLFIRWFVTCKKQM